MAKPNRLNVKQEKFCQEYVKNEGNGSEAYRKVYSTEKMKNKTVWEKASRLLNADKVRARVDEIQALDANRQAMTLDRIISMHARSYEQATRLDQVSAAVAASNSIAKLLGYAVERSEQKIDTIVEHKIVIAEQARSEVIELITKAKKEKAVPTQQIRLIEDRAS